MSTRRRHDQSVDLGPVLRAAREQAGLTQRQVAARAGVTPAALSRWEASRRPVRADDADRVLVACGLDVRFQLVPRHASLDDDLRRRAALPLVDRLLEVVGAVGSYAVERVQQTGAAVLDGAWAAAALGLPPLQQTGGLLLSDDREEQAAVADALATTYPNLLEDGAVRGVVWRADVFSRYPAHVWESNQLGRFTVRVAGPGWAERRLQSEDGHWRAVDPQQLVPDHVDQTALDRWLAT